MRLLFSSLTEEDIELFAVIVYHVWKRMNLFVFEEKFEDPSKLVQTAQQLVSYFKSANERNYAVVELERPHVSNWTPLPLNVFKVNWDAAVDRVRCKVGIGVVVNNWEGQVFATLRSQRSLFPDVKLAEAVAALKPVFLCK